MQKPRGRPPRWLKPVNWLGVRLLRRGWGPSQLWLLSVPGRRTGVMRTTPIATVEVDGERYIVAGWETADWVRNARASGMGVLAHGRQSQRVQLKELPVEERPPILRQFARRAGAGRSFLSVPADGSDDDFARASADHPIFRLDEAASN